MPMRQVFREELCSREDYSMKDKGPKASQGQGGEVVRMGSEKKTRTLFCTLCKPDQNFNFVPSVTGSDMSRFILLKRSL